MQSRGDAFYTLARSIVGQQISVKAADSVWAKLQASSQVHGATELTPDWVASQSDAALRTCGLSGQKVTYLRAIAEYFDRHAIEAGYFDAFSDAEVIQALTSIKGIGTWTAEMFLMFHLMRPDVFPVDDIGLQKGLIKHYPRRMKMAEGEGKKQLYTKMHGVADGFRPFRSVATWYLWRSLDPVPVEY